MSWWLIPIHTASWVNGRALQNFCNSFTRKLDDQTGLSFWSDRFGPEDDSIPFEPSFHDLYLTRSSRVDYRSEGVSEIILHGWDIGWLSDRPGKLLKSVSELPYDPVLVMRFPDEVSRFQFLLTCEAVWELYDVSEHWSTKMEAPISP